MKVLNSLITLGLLVLSQIALANDELKDFVKVYKKDFAVSANVNTFLNNRYGKVNVKTWDKNQTSISVRVTVKANTEDDANVSFNRIKIYFSSGTDFVKGETKISEPSAWENVKEWCYGNGSSDFTIDYEVTIPANGKLDLKNKYGNANIGAMNGPAVVDVKYGNVQVDAISNQLNLAVAYGDANIVKANTVTSRISYGTFKVQAAKNVVLSSAYSTMNIGNVDDLKIDSQYDDFVIGNCDNVRLESQYSEMKIDMVGTIVASAQYSDFNIKKVSKSGDFDMQYGTLKMSNLAKGFNNINVSGQYTDVSIDTEDGASYSLDASTTYADINTPASFKSNIDKERGTSRQLVGVVGSNTGTKSNIKVRLTYGDLTIR